MRGDRPTTLGEAQVITCPKCNARFTFCRSRTPEIDSCGFENYSLECKECGAKLAGIIDPNEEVLLLSDLESQRRQITALGDDDVDTAIDGAPSGRGRSHRM